VSDPAALSPETVLVIRILLGALALAVTVLLANLIDS
jgi:hypothetical protein